jgi:hypothetical protein
VTTPDLPARYATARARLAARLEGLTDAEYLWEPGPGCWTVHPRAEPRSPDPDGAGDWVIDHDESDPSPAPFTTIAWRLVHVAILTTMYGDHAFGPGTYGYRDVVVPPGAAGALAWWHGAAEAFAAHLDGADLDRPVSPPWMGPTTVAAMAWVVLDETTHHGAEIGCLRDLLRDYAP